MNNPLRDQLLREFFIHFRSLPAAEQKELLVELREDKVSNLSKLLTDVLRPEDVDALSFAWILARRAEMRRALRRHPAEPAGAAAIRS